MRDAVPQPAPLVDTEQRVNAARKGGVFRVDDTQERFPSLHVWIVRDRSNHPQFIAVLLRTI